MLPAHQEFRAVDAQSSLQRQSQFSRNGANIGQPLVETRVTYVENVMTDTFLVDGVHTKLQVIDEVIIVTLSTLQLWHSTSEIAELKFRKLSFSSVFPFLLFVLIHAMLFLV